MGNDAWNLVLGFPLIGVSRFLLVSLNIDSILQESTIYRRRERLRRIGDGSGPSGLADVYGVTIERIKVQGRGNWQLAMNVLMWVSHAERPLMVDELCYALAVELGSTNFNSENVPSMSTLISCCQGLITVDKEASTVRLVHFTLKEYLSACPDIFSRPHSAMAEVCLTYLNSKEVKALSTGLSPHIFDTPFLGYCSRHWGGHAGRELSDYARSLALNLLQEYDGHISAKSFIKQISNTSLEDMGIGFRFSGLHCASFFGIEEVVAALLEMRSCDIDEEDSFGNTPLFWAARNGNDGVVKILLEQGVHPDKSNNAFQTPLSMASYQGYEGVVKMLLEREEVNPEIPNNNGYTPLFNAAWGGHAEIVSILLARNEVNLDDPNRDGDTPLHSAARNGHEEIVKRLLIREEVDPVKQNNFGFKPLHYATWYGHAEIVKMLLAREEVNPDKSNNFGNAPLHNAARNGHGEIVKILLACEEVDPDKRDNHGCTPLSIAAQYGHEDVVKILLTREEVNPDNLDNDGDTPLACAAYRGREGVVKILLELEAVNPDRPNHAGQTPLLIAAREGYEEVVKILLEQESVNLSRADNDGQTPFMHAAKNGHQRVIELLQAHEVVVHGTLGGNS